MYFKETLSLIDGNNYITWYYDNILGCECIFVLHMEGNIWRFRDFLSIVKETKLPIYFCDSSGGRWDKHRELIGEFDNGNKIYKLKGLI